MRHFLEPRKPHRRAEVTGASQSPVKREQPVRVARGARIPMHEATINFVVLFV